MEWTITGIFLSTLLLSIKTGLLLGSSGLRMGMLFICSLLLGGSLWLLTFIFAGRAETLAVFIDNYTFAGGLLVAALLIYLSLQFPGPNGSSKQKTDTRFWGLLPCPFCMLAVALTVILLTPQGGAQGINWGLAAAVLFAVLVLAISLLVRQVAKTLCRSTHRLFNGLLFTIGVMTLVFALVIPNITAAMQASLKPLQVENPVVLGLTFVLIITVVSVGHFVCKRQEIRK